MESSPANDNPNALSRPFVCVYSISGYKRPANCLANSPELKKFFEFAAHSTMILAKTVWKYFGFYSTTPANIYPGRFSGETIIEMAEQNAKELKEKENENKMA